MKDFKIVAIRPEAAGGVEQNLQIALEEADKQGYELSKLIEYRDGLLGVWVQEVGKPKSKAWVG
jgi:hypothetical protein